MNNKTFFVVPTIFLIYVIGMIFLWGVNFPFFDQWEFIPLLEKMYANEPIFFSDFFAQHNEHRLLFPRMIMLVLAYFTNWNIIAELYINVVLMACISFFMLNKIKNDGFLMLENNILENKNVNFFFNFLVVTSISLLFFSFAQSENIMWGWQIQIFLNILFVMFGINNLRKSQNNIWNFIFAMFCGIIAGFSFANGLFYFLIGFIIILFLQNQSKKQKIAYLFAWLIFTIIIFSAYFYGYERPPHHPTPQISLNYVLNYIAFVFAFLGNPIFESDAVASMISGMVGVSIYVFGIWKIYHYTKDNWENQKQYFEKYNFYFYLSLYAIGSGLVTALGRTGIGLAQASSSRYVTICNLFWVCNFVIIFILLKENFISQKNKNVLLGLFSIILLTMFASHIVGSIEMYNHNVYMNDCKTKMLHIENTKTTTHEKHPCECAYTNQKIKIIIEGNTTLKNRKLSFYHNKK